MQLSITILEIILLIIILLGFFQYVIIPILNQEQAHRLAGDPTCGWGAITGLDDKKGTSKLPLSMKDYKSNFFLPDVYSVYWHQPYTLKEGESIVLTAEVPRVRYYSFITYKITGEKIGIINGTHIVTDDKGNFQLELANTPSGKYVNSIGATGEYEGQSTGLIIYRLYVPQVNSLGGVKLPQWTIMKGDQVVKHVEECKVTNGWDYFQDFLSQGYALVKAGKILFNHNIICNSTYPKENFFFPDQSQLVNSFFGNPDNIYIGACLTPLSKDKVVIVSGKAPLIGQDLIYWSIDQNSFEGLRPGISGCSQLLVNEEDTWQSPPGEKMWVGDDQQYALVLSTEKPRFPASKVPLSWMYWGKEDFKSSVLIYRQMDPSSKFSASLKLYKGKELDPKELQGYMKDYYPTVKYCTLSDFEVNGANCKAI